MNEVQLERLEKFLHTWFIANIEKPEITRTVLKVIGEKFSMKDMQVKKLFEGLKTYNTKLVYWIENHVNLLQKAQSYKATLDKNNTSLDETFWDKFIDKLGKEKIDSEAFFRGSFIFSFLDQDS